MDMDNSESQPDESIEQLMKELSLGMGLSELTDCIEKIRIGLCLIPEAEVFDYIKAYMATGDYAGHNFILATYIMDKRNFNELDLKT